MTATSSASRRRVSFFMLCGGAILASVVLCVLWVLMSSDVVPRAIDASEEAHDVARAEQVFAAADTRWVDELRSGQRVEIYGSPQRLERDVPDKVIQSLGPLPPEQVERVRGALSLTDSWAEVLKAQTKAEASNDSVTYQKFLEELTSHAKHEAALKLLDRGDYITTPAWTILPQLPDNYLTLGFMGIGKIDGQRVDVWFLLDKGEFAEMRTRWEAVREMDAAAVQAEVEAFNSLPFEERGRRVKAHYAALRQMAVLGRRTSGNEAQGRRPPDEQTQKEMAELRREVIPGRFNIDRQRFVIAAAKRHIQ